MKRLAIRLVLFLMLGAIVNVAVAWGFATYSGRHNPRIQHTAQVSAEWNDWWKEHIPSTAPRGIKSMSSFNAMGLQTTSLYSGRAYAKRVMAGWPALALTGYRWCEPTGFEEPVDNLVACFWIMEPSAGRMEAA